MPTFDDNTKVAPKIPRFLSFAISDKNCGTILKIAPPTTPFKNLEKYK